MVEIYKIIRELFELDIVPNKMQNERYLHHFLSVKFQQNYKVNYEKITESRFHPEWPTYKKSTGIFCGRYKKEGTRYKVCSNGTAGFIDFAIGDYKSPEIGIEITSKFGWGNEEIIYDFVKLLDNKNPFKKVISINFIFREGKLTSGKNYENLINRINNTIKEVRTRLSENRFAKDRIICFLIIEIASLGKNKKRIWFLDNLEKEKFTQILKRTKIKDKG